MKVSETETDPLNHCINLLSSLLHQHIPTIQSFKGKWALIQTKLNDLHTQLTDSSTEFPNYSSNPLSLDLLHSLSQTLNDAVSLAKECDSPTPSQGKLKTQSDLHSLLATLHRHVSDCDILFRSGLLNENDTVSNSTNTRDSVRSQSRNLITRLQIGSPDSRKTAMDSLIALLHEDPKNVVIAVAQGVVPVLVRLLDSSSSEMKEKTVAAISRISTVDSSRHVLIAEGLLLLNHLLRVLDSGSGFSKEKACVALHALSFTKENARAIGSRGGISSLLEICQAGTPGSQASAAGVLRNLAVFPEIKDNFIEENAVFVLLGVASSGTALAQENAIGCLSNFVSSEKEEESLKLLVVKEGGVECLNNFWDSGRNLEVAVEFLKNLASSSHVAEILVNDGFVIPRLVDGLNSGVMAVRIGAGGAVYALGLSSARARKEMGECGCVTPLIKMLDGKSVEEKEVAAKALSVMVLHAGNRRIFRKDERGIVSAVQLLNPVSVQSLDKKYPVSLLASLVHSKNCRKQMVAAGACVYTQKLVELGVEGSKKLLESLGRGKIWGVFARP